MMNEEMVNKLVEEMLPEDLKESGKEEMDRLRKNLDRIDQALPILFRSVTNYEKMLISKIPEVLTDESWEAFVQYASELWSDNMIKFQKTPLNGTARNMYSDVMDIVIEKMKNKKL